MKLDDGPMDAMSCVREVLRRERVSMSELSRRMGRAESFVSVCASKHVDLKSSTLCEMLSALGWELVARQGDQEIAVRAGARKDGGRDGKDR